MTSEATATDDAPSLASSPLLPVRITSQGVGGTVEIAGVDVSAAVASIVLQSSARDVTTIVLELNARGAESHTVFEGLARVVIGEPPEMGPDVARFLVAIDPAELERAALRRDEEFRGEPNSLTKAMLVQLTEWANGRP